MRRWRPPQISYRFSYVYVAGPDDGWMKIGVTGNPVQRLENIRQVFSKSADLQYVFEVPPGLVMLVEACSHSLLADKRIRSNIRHDTERFWVSAKEAAVAVEMAIAAVRNGEFTQRMAVDYCHSVSVKYGGQRMRPKSTSNISPADIVLPCWRRQPVIVPYEQVSVAVGLAESTLYRDIPGGAQGLLDDPIDDVDLPETPTE